jgi:cell division protein FtsI/penicillin-binding protein 2
MMTPLSVAGKINAVANGGILTAPTLVRGFIDEKGEFIGKPSASLPKPALCPDVADKLRDILTEAVDEGTGRPAAPYGLPGLVGGKTATAETGQRAQDGRRISQAWFAGFYPADAPRYSIVVFAEDAQSGGRSAAPVFRKIVEMITD